jgi:hypothetical protein
MSACLQHLRRARRLRRCSTPRPANRLAGPHPAGASGGAGELGRLGHYPGELELIPNPPPPSPQQRPRCYPSAACRSDLPPGLDCPRVGVSAVSTSVALLKTSYHRTSRSTGFPTTRATGPGSTSTGPRTSRSTTASSRPRATSAPRTPVTGSMRSTPPISTSARERTARPTARATTSPTTMGSASSW